MKRNLNGPISENRGIVYLLTMGLISSFGGMFIKSVEGWSSMTIYGARALLCGLVMLAYIGGPRNIRFNRKIFLATISSAIFGSSYVFAMRLTTAASASVFKSTCTIWVILLGVLFFKKKYRFFDYLTVGIVLVGVTLFFFEDLNITQLFGNLLALIAGLSMAWQIHLLNGLKSVEETISPVLLGQFVGFFVALPFYFIEQPPFTFANVSRLVVIGAISFGVVNVLYCLAARACSPLQMSLMSLVDPILTPVWVAIFIKEIPSPLSIVGAVIIIGTITTWTILNARRTARGSGQQPGDPPAAAPEIPKPEM